MNGVRTAELFRRVDAIEHAWCLRLNRGCSRPAVRDIFTAISKLGDGVFWYVLIVLLPVVYGEAAIYPALRMAAVGVVGLALYKYLKSRLVRERPYISLAGITPGTRALDRYSFPSGHTLHAVSFTTLAVQSMPFSQVRRQIRSPQRIQVAGHAAYCARQGQAMVYVPLPGRRVLSVGAPCQLGKQFAVTALQRLVR